MIESTLTLQYPEKRIVKLISQMTISFPKLINFRTDQVDLEERINVQIDKTSTLYMFFRHIKSRYPVKDRGGIPVTKTS